MKRTFISATNFLEQKKYSLISLAFLSFALYQVLKRTVLTNAPSLSHASYLTPDLGPLLFFGFSIVIFLLCYRSSIRLSELKMLALLFLVTILLQASVNSITTMHWLDAQVYHDLGVLGADEGSIDLVRTYNVIGYQAFEHRHNTSFDNVNYTSNIMFAPTSGLTEFSKELVLSITDERFYKSETVFHNIESFSAAKVNPPLWPFILSFFIRLFGDARYSSLLAEWLFSALVPIALYFWIKKFVDKTIATRLAFIFILVPSFLRYSAEPLIDVPLALFIILTAYFYVTSLEKINYKIALVSGIFFSLCLLLKFVPLVLYLPFLVISLLRDDRIKGVLNFLVFSASSMILPVFLLFINYSFFLSVVMAKVSQELTISGHVLPTFLSVVVMPAYFLLNFGIPVMFLVMLGLIRLVTIKKFEWKDKINMVFIVTFFGLEFLLFGSGLDRHLIAFLPLLMPVVAKEFEIQKLNDTFVYFTFAVCIAQLLLFLW